MVSQSAGFSATHTWWSPSLGVSNGLKPHSRTPAGRIPAGERREEEGLGTKEKGSLQSLKEARAKKQDS